MEYRNLRHAAIKKIIKLNKVDSQEALLQHLHENGFPVTQATLSRDLKQLNIVKIADGIGGYFYTQLVLDNPMISNEAFIKDFERGFLSLDFSGNLGVIKTLPGHANSIAYALDNMKIEEILGTIAGDDTILLIPKDTVTKEKLLEILKSKIGILEEC